MIYEADDSLVCGNSLCRPRVPRRAAGSPRGAGPYASAGALKITENENPMPQDRVFFTYNYFDNLHAPLLTPNPAVSSTQSTTVGGVPVRTQTTTSVFFPPAPQVRANLHREVFG